MRTLTYTLLSDGSSDRALMPILDLKRHVFPPISEIARGGRGHAGKEHDDVRGRSGGTIYSVRLATAADAAFVYHLYRSTM